MALTTIESLKNICRTCLGTTKLYSIFMVSRHTLKLQTLLSKYTSIEVKKDDEKPTKMCRKCVDILYRMHAFVETSKKNELKLEEFLNPKITDIIIYENLDDVLNVDDLISKCPVDDKQTLELPPVLRDDYIPPSETQIAPQFDTIEDEFSLDLMEEFQITSDEELNLDGAEDFDLDDPLDILQELESEPVQAYQIESEQAALPSDESMLIIKATPKPLKENSFKCLICEQVFNSSSALKKHRAEFKHWKRKITKYTCPHCDHSNHNFSTIQEHIRTHTGEKPNQCTMCSKMFNSKYALKRHMLTHSEDRPFNCQYCSRGFNRKAYLIDHERMHLGGCLVCQYCGKQFTNKSTLYTHEKHGQCRSNADFKKGVFYICPECNQILSTKQALQAHTLSHRGAQHPCNKCDSICKSKSALRGHMRRHCGERKYTCTHCSRIFVSEERLINHERIHTGEKPFECRYCGKNFTHKVNMTAHLRMHTGDHKHGCKVCGLKFSFKRSLRKHLLQHSQIKIEVLG